MSETSFLLKEAIPAFLAVLAAIGAAVFGVVKVRSHVASANQDTAQIGVERDIMHLLSQEIDRLTLQNAKLVSIVNQLQLEVIQLRGENAEIKQMVKRG